MANYVKSIIHATYTYQGHDYDYKDEDIAEGISDFANVLGYNLEMTKDIWAYERDIELCLIDAVDIAKQFVEEMHPTPSSKHEPTHLLEDSINYSITPSSGASYSGGRLYADAVDGRGHPYAGHIEYGFTDRGGFPRGPWPFLRPAMRLAAAASQKGFADTMAQIITQGFSQDNVIRFGSHDAYSNVISQNAVGRVSHYYGKTSGSGKWQHAKNGIGYRTGQRDANYSSSKEYKWGAI